MSTNLFIAAEMILDIFPAFLVKQSNERFYLRGFFYWDTNEVNGSHFSVFTDMLPFVRKVVAQSHNMYIKPVIPNLHAIKSGINTQIF